MTLRPALAAVVVAGLVVAACSSGTKTTASPSASISASATSNATGSPVKVMVILDESQALNERLGTVRDGVNARVARIDSQGGLGGSGHPVAVDFCSTDLDPNKALACARTAAGDPSYVAVAASETAAADIAPVLAEAGLPDVPAAAIQPGDFKSSNVFATNAGVLLIPAVSVLACKLGYHHINELRTNLPSSAVGTSLANLALKSHGCNQLQKSVDLPLGQADVSPQVTAVAQGADAVVSDVAPAQNQQVLAARTQLGISTPFLTATGVLSNDAVKSLGPSAEGIKLASALPTDDVQLPGNTTYLADMKALRAQHYGDAAKMAWVSIDLLNTAVKGLTTLNRSTILAALNRVASYDAGGLLPPMDFAKPGPNPTFPRMFNLTYFHAVIQNGRPVAAPGRDSVAQIFGSGS
jgi:ABC-type branched-subunit amino acid transport system substrate-binding protein